MRAGKSTITCWITLKRCSATITGEEPETLWNHNNLIVTRYYARRLAPRVDIRIVLVALVTIVSALQYYVAWFNFEAAISHLATVPKYRLQVKNKKILLEICY